MSEVAGKAKWTRSKIRRVLLPVLWIGGLLYTVRSHFNGCPQSVILGAWLLVPPVCFMLEYRWLFDRDHDDWDRFKYTQGLARNLWLGVVAFLAVLYFPLQ